MRSTCFDVNRQTTCPSKDTIRSSLTTLNLSSQEICELPGVLRGVIVFALKMLQEEGQMLRETVTWSTNVTVERVQRYLNIFAS